MSETNRITFMELVKGCFHFIKTVRVGESQVGGYVVRYTYRHPPNPHGDQTIWLLYHPKSIKPILKELDHIKACCEKWDGSTLFVDDYDPNETSLAVDVALLCDGRFTCGAFTLAVKGGVEGHIGVVVGQGRYINLEEEGMPWLIHMLLANALPLPKDRFIRVGREELAAFTKKLQNLGCHPRRVKTHKHGNMLKPTPRQEP